MPYANNQGIRIYYEVEGQGPPLMLLHGSRSSLESFYDLGFVDALKDDYRLILFDARGHGRSDKPHDPRSYRMRWMVSDIVAVLDSLGLGKAHFWGYSMGGRIAWWATKYAPEHFHSLIIGGALPYDEVPRGFSQEETLQIRQEVQGLVAAQDVDAQVAYTIGNLNLPRVYSTSGIQSVLPAMAMPCPCLLYIGERDLDQYAVDDDYLRCVKHMPNLTFICLPGLDHLEAAASMNLVLPHVRKFLVEVGKG